MSDEIENAGVEAPVEGAKPVATTPSVAFAAGDDAPSPGPNEFPSDHFTKEQLISDPFVLGVSDWMAAAALADAPATMTLAEAQKYVAEYGSIPASEGSA